jgi:serine protease Do
MGITVETLSSTMKQRLGLDEDQQGVLVTDVEYDSEASNKGVRRNAVIVSVNDRPVGSVRQWVEVVEQLEPGTAVKLNLLLGNTGTYVFLRAPER